MAGGGEAVDVEPADRHRIGTEGDRLDDIGAAGDRAVDDDTGAAGDRLDHFRQYRDRAQPLVELAPTMVRDVDAIDPVVDRDLGVLGGGDALEDQWDVEIPLDPLDVLPVELRLVDPRIIDPHAAALVTFGDVALAAAVAVGVDRQTEGVVALVGGTADMIVDPGRVAPHIKLEDPEPVAGSLGGLVHAGLGHRGEDYAVAEFSGRGRDRRATARIE